ncbi:DUF4351 domain-containing protein [Coleofasciculus sp. G2-EDA-02]|uniref:DUF4351 domain-containing protein n=1 Tax=Coleofasciculus sp. G2-EDA-02 TaxID=3069529 RepID=UPI0033054C0D
MRNSEERGEAKGRIKEAITLVMRQLTKRFGEIPVPISSQIEDLSIENLEGLGEDFLDFNSLEDLSNWLEVRSH